VAVSRVPTYRGHFGIREAERLLWRAGFGPFPGEAEQLAKHGLRSAVRALTRPKRKKAGLYGPEPTDDDGNPLAPYDAYGHDLLWWLDRMVRSNQPLIDRMALIWHDWFATGDVDSQRLSIAQIQLFQRRGLGSFRKLLLDVTRDPAMLVWLDGVDNTKDDPNENYGREMMELFALGAADPATGYPYSEQDVREQARALTGWTADYEDDFGYTSFYYDRELHDFGGKRILGKKGKFDWRDSCELCLRHKAHAPYFVDKLWSYFVPVPPSGRTRKALQSLYRRSDYAIRPVVEAILMHPELYNGPALVKPPVVQIAGMLKARGRGIDTESWTWITDQAGMRPFDPPNVAGWDETRWLDTSTFRGRWTAANRIVRDEEIDPDEDYPATETTDEAIAQALAYWGNPTISGATRAELAGFCDRVAEAATQPWQQDSFRALRQNALRMLIATSPDLMAC
jgi:uncharacterized protein (DUF1800 family)